MEHDCIPDEHYVQTLFSVRLVIVDIDLQTAGHNRMFFTTIHNVSHSFNFVDQWT